MKTKSHSSFHAFKVCILVFAVCGFAANGSAQEFRTVHNGIEYAEVTREVGGQPVRMNLLRLDLSKVRLDVIHAGGVAIGTETTSSIAARHHAVAAINAGFFRLDTSAFAGDPAGIFQIDGKLLSESNNERIALLIDNSARNATKASFEHLNTYAEFWSGQIRFNIGGIDRQIKENDAVLYTPEFGAATPQTESEVLEVVIQNKKVKDVLTTSGKTKIPVDGYVLTLGGTKRASVASVVVGKEALIITGSYAAREPSAASNAVMKFIDIEDIVAGVPQLIKDGKVDITWEKEKTTKSFVETRHPRTAVAKLKDGKFLMITVDGRSESSGGIGLYDLATYLMELGATDAMNLDGGGSTTMFLDGKVVNHPSDKEGERKVSDTLVVTLRKTGRGR